MSKSNRCKGTNKDGKPCGAAATATGYCYIHSNPGIAAELGRAGGRKNRRFITLEPRRVPSLNGASGGRNVAEQAIADVYERRLSASEATAVSSLLRALSGFVSPEVERQMNALEEKIKAMQRGNPGQGEAPSHNYYARTAWLHGWMLRKVRPKTASTA